MYPTNPELLARIESFALDTPGVILNFSARLARENGWSAQRAANVVREYRRFLYLAMVAGHPVTPSEDVDQAWHLHMIYTRSYWTELCGTVLGQPLHHDPTTGGSAEGAKFEDWYGKTLQSYTREFGSPPPEEIWPKPRARFSQVKTERDKPATHWVIRKPRSVALLARLTSAMSLPKLALIAGACLLLPGCSDGSTFSIALISFEALIVMAIFWRLLGSKKSQQPHSRRPTKSDSGSGISHGASCGMMTNYQIHDSGNDSPSHADSHDSSSNSGCSSAPGGDSSAPAGDSGTPGCSSGSSGSSGCSSGGSSCGGGGGGGD